MARSKLNDAILRVDHTLAAALAAAEFSKTHKGDGTFVSFAGGVAPPASAAAFGAILPKGGVILFGIMPGEVEALIAPYREAKRAALEAVASQAEAEAVDAAAKAQAEEAETILRQQVGLEYFTNTTGGPRSVGKFNSTTKKIEWLASLDRIEVDGSEYLRSTKGRIEQFALDLNADFVGFAVKGQELWRGPVKELHANVSAYLVVRQTAVGVAMRQLRRTDWTLAEALLRHTPEFYSEVVRLAEPEMHTQAGSNYNPQSKYRYTSYTCRYFRWSDELRRFGVRIGPFTIAYQATGKTRDGMVLVGEDFALTDEVQAKLDAAPTKGVEEVEWAPESVSEHAAYKAVLALIDLARTTNTPQKEPIPTSLLRPVAMWDYGGEIRQMGRTERHGKWVIASNGETRKPNSGDPTSYAGEVWWDEIHPTDLVIEWSKAYTAADHEFTVVYRPADLTAAQLATVKELEDGLRREWDGVEASFSERQSPPVGNGWALNRRPS